MVDFINLVVFVKQSVTYSIANPRSIHCKAMVFYFNRMHSAVACLMTRCVSMMRALNVPIPNNSISKEAYSLRSLRVTAWFLD